MYTTCSRTALQCTTNSIISYYYSEAVGYTLLAVSIMHIALTIQGCIDTGGAEGTEAHTSFSLYSFNP